jgi:hypothetical protein
VDENLLERSLLLILAVDDRENHSYHSAILAGPWDQQRKNHSTREDVQSAQSIGMTFSSVALDMAIDGPLDLHLIGDDFMSFLRFHCEIVDSPRLNPEMGAICIYRSRAGEAVLP